jgi:hypothetical protein
MPEVPVMARFAGILWVIYGCLGIVNTVISLTGSESPKGLFCGSFIAIAFAYVGYQTLKGQAKDTIGNGIGSILLGILVLALVIFLFSARNNVHLDNRGEYMISVYLAALAAAILFVGWRARNHGTL